MTDVNAENQMSAGPRSTGTLRTEDAVGRVVHDGGSANALVQDPVEILKPRESALVVSALGPRLQRAGGRAP